MIRVNKYVERKDGSIKRKKTNREMREELLEKQRAQAEAERIEKEHAKYKMERLKAEPDFPGDERED